MPGSDGSHFFSFSQEFSSSGPSNLSNSVIRISFSHAHSLFTTPGGTDPTKQHSISIAFLRLRKSSSGQTAILSVDFLLAAASALGISISLKSLLIFSSSPNEGPSNKEINSLCSIIPIQSEIVISISNDLRKTLYGNYSLIIDQTTLLKSSHFNHETIPPDIVHLFPEPCICPPETIRDTHKHRDNPHHRRFTATD